MATKFIVQEQWNITGRGLICTGIYKDGEFATGDYFMCLRTRDIFRCKGIEFQGMREPGDRVGFLIGCPYKAGETLEFGDVLEKVLVLQDDDDTEAQGTARENASSYQAD